MQSKGFKNAIFTPHKDDAIDFIVNNAAPNDIVLTLGAGDITTFPDAILSAYA